MGNAESLLAERPFKPNNTRVRLYRLCDVCKRIISSSPLLRGEKQREDFLSGSAFSDLLPPLDISKLKPFDPELSVEFGQGDRDGPFYMEGEYEHCLSAAALEISAGSGCHLCSLLWQSVSTEPSHRIGLYIHRDFKIFKAETNRNARTQLHFEAAGPPDQPLVVRIGHRRSSHSTECGVIALYAGKVGNSPIPKLRSVLKVLKSANMYEVLHGRLNEPNFIRDSISTTSDAVFGMIENWLKDCKTNHKECNQQPSLGVITKPSRLIDVGPPDGSANPRLYVCQSQDQDQELSYVTLSHCWGGTSPLILTSTNSEAPLTGLPLASFPATFRDAIQITRRLRQRYLWIDSLCIFQDSKADWQAESARMGAIYHNCAFSIAALSGRNSHHGCFATRNPLSYRPLPLPCKPDYYFIQTILPYPWTEDSFTRAPLLRRGWVLQERCLAPRTIYFGDHGVYWECREARMDENHRFEKGRKAFERESGDLEAKMTLANVKLGTPESSSETDGDAEHWFLDAWYRLIEHYATCQFTFGRDKLVAIAGVVDDVQRRTGLSSFAGLWKEYLLRELLWSVNIEEPCSRPTEYRSPSFSWASLDGFIVPIHEARQFHAAESGTGKAHPREKLLATILNAEVKVAIDGRTSGAVIDGHILIEAPGKRVTVHNSQAQSGLDAIWTHPEQVLEHREQAYRAGKFCKTPNRWFRLDTNEMNQYSSLDVVLILLVSWSGALNLVFEEKDYDNNLHIAGIVLQQNSEKPYTFRRIGMFEDCFDESLASWWKDWDREVVEIV